MPTPSAPAATTPAAPATGGAGNAAVPAAPAQPSPAPETAQASAAAPEPAAPAGTTYVIAAGDNYWKLAERFYKDGFQWRRIAEANPKLKAREMTIGATLTIPPAP